VSIEIEPPSNPSTGKVTCSPSLRKAITKAEANNDRAWALKALHRDPKPRNQLAAHPSLSATVPLPAGHWKNGISSGTTL